MDKPYSKEAEMAVIGAVVIDPVTVLNIVMAKIKVDYFYFRENKIIFETLLQMFNNNEKIDFLTVKERLKRNKQFTAIGGEEYLTDITDEVMSVINIDEYIKIVEDKYVLRHLIETSQNIAKHCYSEKDVNEIIDYAENEIFKVQENRYKQDVISVQDKIPEIKKIIEHSKEHVSDITGIPTGFTDLDLLTTGFHPGELIIIAARPGVGKTSFALNMMLNACLGKDKYTGLIFSFEMTTEQLLQRMLCTAASVSSQKLRRGKLNPTEQYNLQLALNKLENANIYIDDSTHGTPVDIKAKSRRLKKEKNLDFIIIDYLQMMHIERRMENKQIEVSEISRSLKLLAKELSIPVIALAQLSRNPEKRDIKTPILSDIRDSGSIEQDADVVVFIHRKFEKGVENDETKLILAKQRNGPIGDIDIYFNARLTQFKNKLPGNKS